MLVSLGFAAAGCGFVALWVLSYQQGYWFSLRKVSAGLGVVRSWNGYLSYEELISARPVQTFTVAVPYAALAIAAGACAALPWVAWSRRWSLRALVILTTVAALVAGIASIRR